MTQKPYEEIYEAPRDPFKGVRNEQLSDDLPFDSRAGLSIEHYFPADAEYVFKVRFRGIPAAIEGEPDHYEFRLPVKAGLHRVGVTSPRENAKSESEGPGARAVGAGVIVVPYPVDLRVDGARVKRFDADRRNAGSEPPDHRRAVFANRAGRDSKPRENFRVPAGEGIGRGGLRQNDSENARPARVPAPGNCGRRGCALRRV